MNEDCGFQADTKSTSSASEPKSIERRVALQRLAFHSAVTAPMMMAILTSEKAIAQRGGGGGGCIPECNFDV
ncbi:MAG: hypothetical protein NBV68_04385 [Erythrobacter sp.]|uniref:hypothetical protein n=1 Tax=Erythrobacter sp. TaxID=1042 RepID=UPI0025E9E32A|nr:hypothetical protein [Erythrobacter sp.]MCL9998596.1 hypothetical protein [Erythrobacter sp.]